MSILTGILVFFAGIFCGAFLTGLIAADSKQSDHREFLDYCQNHCPYRGDTARKDTES